MLSVATWNLENLFRPGAESGPPTDTAYQAKLAARQEVIERLAPDVLAVQEVGEPEALEDLRAQLGDGWRTAVSTAPDGRGIRVGFLSKLAMERVEYVRAFPPQLAAVQQDDRHVIAQTTGRGAMRVRVQHGGEPIDLVTCHLKSKLLTFPAVGSTRAMRANAHASAPTRSTGAPPKRSLCAPTSTNCLTAAAASAR